MFPDRPPSPRKTSEDDSSAEAMKLPEPPKVTGNVATLTSFNCYNFMFLAYRPPGSTGMLSNMLRAKDTPAPAGKVGKFNASSAPVVQPRPIRVIPGMSPQMVAEAQQKAAKAAKKKEQRETVKETKAAVIDEKSAEGKDTGIETKAEMTSADIDKRIRALKKKLKLIEELKEKKVHRYVFWI